jgi:hypothetical protein
VTAESAAWRVRWPYHSVILGFDRAADCPTIGLRKTFGPARKARGPSLLSLCVGRQKQATYGVGLAYKRRADSRAEWVIEH